MSEDLHNLEDGIESATIQRAEENLRRQLDWVGRHDARAAFIAGVCITMLGVIANLNWNTVTSSAWLYYFFTTSLLILLLSLLFICLSQFPKVKSPNSSLLFFGTIVCRSFKDFSKEFKELNDKAYLDDLLHQIYINAKILKQKFDYLKTSLVLLLAAVIPWLLTIYIFKQL